MYNEFGGTLSNLALAKHRKSRAINAENPRGEKGKGGMAYCFTHKAFVTGFASN